MKGNKPVKAHNAIEVGEGRFIPMFRRKVVSRREHVTGVNADSHPFLFFDEVDNRSKLFKTISNGRSLTCRCFEACFDLVAGRRGVEKIDRLCYALDPFLFSGSPMRTG